ncbi:MAG: hypothetical protein IPP83_08670 [Flavobacteriales bacterium]|nr:hypothetical protein [Flavobacteriales bacterium]
MTSRSKCIDRALVLVLAVLPLVGVAQPRALGIDRVIAVVGREAILYSELVVKVEQARQADPRPGYDHSCDIIEDLLYEKLLVEQGKLDSVVVDEGQVNAELDRRIRYFSQQLGGDKKLEEYYGKSVAEIKADFKGSEVKDHCWCSRCNRRSPRT